MSKKKKKKKAKSDTRIEKAETRIIRKVKPRDAEALRREHDRVEGNVRVVYQLLDENSLAPKEQWAPFGGVVTASEHSSTARDLSVGGTLFFTDNEMPVKSKLGMRIELPDGKGPIRCIAEVVRVQEIKRRTIYATAVSFVDMVKSDRDRIEDFIKSEDVEEYVLGAEE